MVKLVDTQGREPCEPKALARSNRVRGTIALLFYRNNRVGGVMINES